VELVEICSCTSDYTMAGYVFLLVLDFIRG